MSIQLLLNRMHFTHRIPHNPFLMYILFTSYSQNCQAFWHNVIYSLETFDPHLSKFKLHPVMMSHQIQIMAGKFKFQNHILEWCHIKFKFWREIQISNYILVWHHIKFKFLAGISNSNYILVLHYEIFGGKFKFKLHPGIA